MPKAKSDAPESSERKKDKSFKKYILIVIAVIVVLAITGAGGYFFLQYQKTQQLLRNPGQPAASEIPQLVAKVSKHYDLPESEQPTLATVSDVTKLASQPFFAKAHNDDKVLIYSKAGLAILYRPSLDKIINVGPVNLQSANSSESAAPTAVSQSAPLKVALYNGTKVNGLTKQVEEKLKTLSSLQTQVVVKTNSSADYTESVVVDLTGKNVQAATQLAAFAKGKVASLPATETKPNGVDILIILGQSYVGGTTSIPTPIP